jgi:hypothetical protein
MSGGGGGEDEADYMIVVNGCESMVRPNLFRFLQQIRRSGDCFLLWMNAICINQEHWFERKDQVSRVNEIFTQS